ncbi:flagellar protein [Candidatus Photodesmus blepharus]|uniref:Flagellar protein n=1 Tax=Candidatus Photodesmus blepharonis TaxID=1179155 RepID=A0A084CNZ5_9GAMM|nr:flagellar biosynthetic protein FliO [Candidatus Photodesmus blepharus]KEY91524.1 flagellar protein [Candidatus Photodesmus blepharus]
MQPKVLLFSLLPSSAFSASEDQINLMTTFGSLLFVIALMLFLAWFFKKMRLPILINQKNLSIIQQLPVGAKERIMIIEAGEERFLVGVTSRSIKLISKLEKSITQEHLQFSKEN